jgi:hypothetical protein
MKGFKPTGYGPSSGFKFPARMGFTGSTGSVTSVAPYTRRKAFADGGFVRQDNPRMKSESVGDSGSALQRRSRPTTQLDAESGGRSPLRPGFKRGGKLKKMRKADGGYVDAQRELEYRKAHYDDTTDDSKFDDPRVTPAQVRKQDQAIADAAASPNHRINLKTTKMRGYYGPQQPSGSDFEETQRPKGHGPIKPPRTHASKGHGPIRSIPGQGKRLGAFAAGGAVMSASPLSTLSKMRRKPPRPPSASTMKERFAADGGHVAYGSSSKGFMSDVSKLPEALKEVLRSIGSRSSGMARKGADTVSGRQRQVDRAVDEAVTGKNNYSRGGKLKRMGYADGGQVSREEAKKIAERTVGEHVRYPAPKGHKGLGKMCKADGGPVAPKTMEYRMSPEEAKMTPAERRAVIMKKMQAMPYRMSPEEARKSPQERLRALIKPLSK